MHKEDISEPQCPKEERQLIMVHIFFLERCRGQVGLEFPALVIPHVGFTQDSDTQLHYQLRDNNCEEWGSLLWPHPDRCMAVHA